MVDPHPVKPRSPEGAAPAKHYEFSLLPGIAFTGFGVLFLAPLLYRADAFAGSAHAVGRLLGLSMAIAFVAISLPAFAHAIRNHRPERESREFLTRLERLFFGLGHLVVIVTLVGMSGLVFFGMRSGVSGVPVGMGMLITGLMYACGGLCRVIR